MYNETTCNECQIINYNLTTSLSIMTSNIALAAPPLSGKPCDFVINVPQAYLLNVLFPVGKGNFKRPTLN